MTMTIAAENGFEVGKNYRVKEGVNKNYYTAGMILKFIQDDGSDMPLFKILEGNAKCKWPDNETHIYLCDLEPISVDNSNGKQMSNKTEVQITTATKEDIHNIGDYYKLDDDLYILANVQARAVLIDLNKGNFFAKPVGYALSSYEVNGLQFSKCCGSRYGDFVKVQKVKISIE